MSNQIPTSERTRSLNVSQLNQHIELFPEVHPITPDMTMSREGVSRMVMLDRYAFKDTEHKTLSVGDFVVLTVKEDPNYPTKGFGYIEALNGRQAVVWVEEEFRASLPEVQQSSGLVTRNINTLDKPLEIFYEQIAKRVATGLANVEETDAQRNTFFEEFNEIISTERSIPAGRVLYGAGSGSDVTFFNCFIQPFMHDSREGIMKHITETASIMSRGGGVGTNGSTLRPKNSLAKGVNGKSSGSVSWLQYLSQLTNLIQQGGSRRGAQMIMLADWHPDIIEFIISKMQNPNILKFILENFKDDQIKQFAEDNLKFKPFKQAEITMFQDIANNPDSHKYSVVKDAQKKLEEGGTWETQHPEMLTGANISVAVSNDFMAAVKADAEWELKYPDTESYTDEQMAYYDTHWHEVGDVREWERDHNMPVKVYRTIKAKELWQLINFCATYSAEPGIFFIDRANDMAMSNAYGQKVVATNPCGEQPLPGFSVCNLSAINLAKHVNKETNSVDYDLLKDTVRKSIRMQDNVIDATYYFFDPNTVQAKSERRIGLGVLGLADMMIYTHNVYGSKKGIELVDKVFETIAITAWEASIELAKEKGSFPFLIGKTDEETQSLREAFVNTGYIKERMPQYIKDDILKYGVRNVALLTVAPTGSTGTMANVSTGLEPYFAFTYYRSGRLGKFIEVQADIVQEYLDKHPEAESTNLPDFFVSAMDLSPEAHADVQNAIQYWVDSSISKTVNMPKGSTPDDVAKIYERLFDGGAKGGTVYVDGSRDSQVLTLSNENNEFEELDTTQTSVDDPEELRRLVNSAEKEHRTTYGDTDDVTYGSEIGNTCPACRQGVVQDIGGCNTCTSPACGMQLKCGL